MKKTVVDSSYRKKNSFMFVFPSLLFLLIFMIYPMMYSFYLSLTEYNFAYDDQPRFVGLSNYMQMFSDQYFIDALTNTFFFTAFFFPLAIIFAFILAYLINKPLKGALFFRTSVLLPVVVPLALTGIIFQWILNENYGLVNHILISTINMPQLATEWLTHPDWAMYSIILISLWKYIGIAMVLFLVGLQMIPKELYEAAKIDGANSFQEVICIIIPNLKETFAVIGIWAILLSLKIFEQSFIMTQGGPGTSTLVLYHYFWQSAFRYYDMGYASAMGYFVGFLVLTLSLINLYLTRSKI